MQIKSAVLGENDFWGRQNFTSGNREGEEEREGEEQKRAPFFSPSSLLRKNPEGKKKALGFKMILDFTPPTKGLHGGPLETLPKGIPVTLAKYLRGNQERKDEGEIRNVNNPIATGLSVSVA